MTDEIGFPSRDVSARAAGQPGRRGDVLRVLRAAPAPLRIVEIADRLGVHPNTVRFHLDALLDTGQVERAPSNRRGPGRPSLRFRPARGMDPTGPRHYRLLAQILANSIADGPDPAARAVEAGRAWGRLLPPPDPPGPQEPVERLVALLDGLGFAPQRRDDGGRVRVGLRHCPFLELVETRAEVICPIHLGLMQGALGAWAAPVTVDRLEAFVEPDLCLAHVAPAAAPDEQSPR